jgi:hypothetical protein
VGLSRLDVGQRLKNNTFEPKLIALVISMEKHKAILGLCNLHMFNGREATVTSGNALGLNITRRCWSMDALALVVT